ncbi:MAG: bifunctional 4-hydroxy-2-oxoglutarate aldolase/2-dehydro-3-deoxy-phosphogluconate aldolase [Rhodothermales bacterium]|nr:bifunctional 4-hydroxy-2-oxoglutarate aldolase/2-dehydro-3-deoxy-phosphogluconate aldolase [Rhodothermales bacterium]
MARHTRIQVAQTMAATGLVPLAYHADAAVMLQIVKACYEGGARVFEFTNRGDFAHEVFAEVSRAISAEAPDMMLGVGSVADAGTASIYLQLGADFIVQPSLREDVVRVCNRRKVLWAAGCATLTEVARAEELGAEIVKIFPGGTVGPGFVKAIKGPCPWTSLMPTGGVSPTRENLTEWFEAGVTCVGMGSKLITSQTIADGDFDGLAVKVRDTLGLIDQIRRQSAA